MTPICLSRFPPQFPDGNAAAVLCFQSQPTESKENIFRASAKPNTSGSVDVCTQDTHVPVYPGWPRAAALPGLWVSEKLDKCPREQKGSQQHVKKRDLKAEDKMACGTRAQERAFWWASSTVFTFVIKERAGLPDLCITCAVGVTRKGRVWWCSFFLCTPLQNHSTLCTSPRSCEGFL